MATHFSILAWRIPWTEEPGRQQSIGSPRVRLKRLSLHALWPYLSSFWFLLIAHFSTGFELCAGFLFLGARLLQAQRLRVTHSCRLMVSAGQQARCGLVRSSAPSLPRL